MGLIRLHAVPTGIVNLRLRSPVVGVVEVPFLIQHLTVGNLHHVSCLRIHGEADISRHLLAEIHHRLALRGGEYTLCGHIFLFTRLFALLRNQILRSLFQTYDGQRLLCLKRGVTGFSVVNLTETDPALFCRPAFIRRDYRFRPVLTGQNKLRNQSGRHMGFHISSFAVHPAGHGAPIPPFSNRDLKTVLRF